MDRSSPSPRALFGRACARALVASLLVTIIGCQRGGTVQDPARGATPELRELLPADAEGVLLLDVRTLLAAPFVQRLDERLSSVLDERAQALRELLGRVDRVAVGYRYRPAESESGLSPFVVLARGRFDDDDLDLLGQDHAPGEHREHRLRHGDGMVLALVADHTLAFGTNELVLGALDRLDGLAPLGGPNRPLVLDAARRVALGEHTLTYAAEISEALRGELAEDWSPRASTVSMGARVDVGSAVVAHAFARFTDAEVAQQVMAELEAKLAEAAQEPYAAEAGVHELRDALRVSTEGPVLLLDLSLEPTSVERVITIVLLGVQAGSSFEAPADEGL